MTDPNYTHLTLIVDRSGSMASLHEEASTSINNLMKEQRELNAGKMTVSLVQFDDRYEVVDSFVPIAFVEEYKLQPRGMTAMNDSLYKAIVETQDKIDNLPEDERPSSVIIAIMTDGYENASQEVSNADLHSLVQRRQNEDGWTFVFMASNIDAKHIGMVTGISNTRNVAHDSMGYTNAYATFSSTIAAARTTNTSFEDIWSQNKDNN